MVEDDLKGPHRPLDVLEREASKIAKFGGHPVHHGVSCVSGNQDPARRRLSFETRGDVHAIAIQIITVNDDIADVNSDPECDRFVIASIEVCLSHRALKLDCRVKRIDDTCELNQRAITNQLDESTAVVRQNRFKPLGPVLGQHRESSALVALHEPRVTDNIQRNYGRQFSPLSCQSNCPFLTAGSTGRRNTGLKSLCWGFKLQGLTWSFV